MRKDDYKSTVNGCKENKCKTTHQHIKSSSTKHYNTHKQVKFTTEI